MSSCARLPGARCLNEIACLHEGVQQYQPQLAPESASAAAGPLGWVSIWNAQDHPVLPGRG